MAGVRFEDVTKRYGTVTVIEHLDLEIHDHEFMVLVGPSGCGKSTALRMIAGLEEITSGRIYIADRVVNDLPPKDRDIAMVFQSYALYPHMTVRENLDFGLRIRKMPAAEINAAVDDAAQILGISHLLDRKPKELSGGQRQRVAVGRAIVRHPSVFLFDEPLSNLDAKLRVQMRAEITKLQQRLRTTCVYVTHDQVEAMTMGHRIAVMKDGFVQQVGTPLEVYEKPVNLFVATFIGTPPMNFLKAQIAGGAFVGDGFHLVIPPDLQAVAQSASGREVQLGIRPEAAHEKSAAVHGEVAMLKATVEMVEPLGHEVIIHTKVGEEPFVAVFDPHQVPQLGETIDLQIEMNRLHIFDMKDERRITV